MIKILENRDYKTAIMHLSQMYYAFLSQEEKDALSLAILVLNEMEQTDEHK